MGGRPFALDPTFIEDLDTHSVTDAAASLGRPFLVVEAGNDQIVGDDQTAALAAAGDGDRVVVEGADHLFTAPDHARQLVDIVVKWATGNATG